MRVRWGIQEETRENFGERAYGQTRGAGALQRKKEAWAAKAIATHQQDLFSLASDFCG